MKPPRILVFEPNSYLLEALNDLLTGEGFEVQAAPTLSGALAALHERPFSLVLADYSRALGDDPVAALDALLAAAGPIPVACATLMRLVPPEMDRRFAFVTVKPFDVERLLSQIGQVTGPPLDEARGARARQYFASLSAAAWDDVAALCTADVEYHVGGTDPRFSRILRGRDQFRDFTRTTFQQFPEARFEVLRLSPLPEGVVAEYVGNWRGPAGEPHHLGGAVVFAFRGDQIARIGVHLDLARLRVLAT